MSNFISPDRYFDPESGRLSAYFSKLFILIGQESLQYCILDTEKNTFIALTDFRLPSSPKSKEVFYAEISQLFSEEEALKKKYPAVVIGLDSAVHTLVPAPLYDADQNKKYLEFNFGPADNGSLRVDRLEEIDAFNIYGTPQGLLDVVVNHFGEAALIHRSSALLKAIYHYQNIHPARAGIFLNIREQFIDLVSMEGGRLAFFNSYACSSKEDVLYYTLYALEQLSRQPENVQLLISGIIDGNSDLYRLLVQYIYQVSFTDRINLWEYSPLLGQLPSHRFLELYALALCGS